MCLAEKKIDFASNDFFFDMFLYILQLQNGRWYVGTTLILTVELLKHHCGEGNEWTREHVPIGFSTKYPPIRLEKESALCRHEEDKWVKRLMLEYGIDKVRGGSYSHIAFSRQYTPSRKRARAATLQMSGTSI